MSLLIVVTLILVVADVVVRQSIVGIFFIVIFPVLRLEEGASISVSDVETFCIAARETMDAVDDVLWER